MRKGQVEMIGLLVIVFLIIVIGFFFLQLGRPKESNLEAGREATKVGLLLNAMKKYSVCEGVSLSEVLGDCSKNNGGICGFPSSCDLAKGVVKNISDALLVVYNYDFSVKEIATFKVSSKNKCVEGRDNVFTAESILAIGGGQTLNLKYSYCKPTGQ